MLVTQSIAFIDLRLAVINRPCAWLRLMALLRLKDNAGLRKLWGLMNPGILGVVEKQGK